MTWHPEDIPSMAAELEHHHRTHDTTAEAWDGTNPNDTYAPRVHCEVCGSTWGPVPHGCGRDA